MSLYPLIIDCDEVLNNCCQDDYSFLMRVFAFIGTDCYKFQSFVDFLDEQEETELDEHLEAGYNSFADC